MTRVCFVLSSIQVVVGSYWVHTVVIVKLGVCLVDKALLSNILGLFVFLDETDI